MNKLTKKSVSLLLSGAMVLGAVASGYPSLAVERNDVMDTTETKTLSSYSGSCGENIFWNFDESTGTLTITGEGEIDSYETLGDNSLAMSVYQNARPWRTHLSKIKIVVITEGITSISDGLFYSCTNLEEIDLPSTLTSIGLGTFSNCSNLTVISIPDEVKEIGYSAFANCSNLVSIKLPNGLMNIESHAFFNCSNLVTIDLPESVITIDYEAFKGCKSLKSITIPSGVTDLQSTFVGCSSLETVILPDTLEQLVGRVFQDCISLKDIEIPQTLRNLNDSVFVNCASLKQISLPITVSIIGTDVFTNCNQLSDLFYSGTTDEWNEIKKGSPSQQFYGSGTNLDIGLTDFTTIHYNTPMPDTTTTSITYALPSATLHTSYLTAVHDINATSTLVSGNLPKGLGLYADGVIGGIPQETGEFQFVIATSQGEVGYSITVEEPTSQNVEANNDFDIIERVPTVDSNETSYVFEVTGEFSDFLNVYIDGQLLVDEVHYIASEGSTKIVIAAQTMSQLDSGSHTINATFTTTNATVTPTVSSGSSSSSGTITTTNSSKSANVASVAQVFNKTVEAAPMMAMPFTDVAVSDWHYQYVRYMYDTSTFSGVTNTTYEPNTGMTRGMMAVVFYGMANKPSTGSANFSDVAEGEWYADAVNWISQRGIDDSVGVFRPTDLITREETAKMMYNFCTDLGIFIPLTTSRTPSDLNSVSENAKNAVNILFSKGIFAGDDANNFNPHNTSTRAEISAMMRTFMWATV